MNPNDCNEDNDMEDDCPDPSNFKGIYYDNPKDTHYTDTASGAHFKYEQLYRLLEAIKATSHRTPIARSHSNNKKTAVEPSTHRATSKLVLRQSSENRKVAPICHTIKRNLNLIDDKLSKASNIFCSVSTIHSKINIVSPKTVKE